MSFTSSSRFALFLALVASGCSSTDTRLDAAGDDALGSHDGAAATDTALDGNATLDGNSALDAFIPRDARPRIDAGFPAGSVSLGEAGRYVILAKSGISTVPASAITGDIAVSPAAATFITGFSLVLDPTTAFSTCTQVTGSVYAADYATPTPAALTSAVGDMQLAFTDAAGRAADVTELGAGNIGAQTLAPGVYAWGTGLLIPTDVTLTGTATDVWIFQIAGDLTMTSGARVALAGGAEARNVFWVVAGRVELGTTTHSEGVILTQTSITLRTGASVHGRLLAQTAVDIDSSTITEPD